ncbi:imm11 family protein [Christiangramia marina]|uniref:imm11 family protein n=1 Tax=Christiangramia marina TaxID=409436 RepID=UPI003AA807B9
MKIYRIEVDVKKYQWIMADINEDDSNFIDIHFFNGKEKNNWPEDIDFYIYNTKNLPGNFFYLDGGSALVFDQAVYDSPIFDIFEQAGQIIPINCSGEKLYILNVLECINMLDLNKSQFEIYDDGSKGEVLEFHFHEERISESSIFKIPQMNASQVLTYCDVKDASDEFFNLYNKFNFTGLVFEKLYETPAITSP